MDDQSETGEGSGARADGDAGTAGDRSERQPGSDDAAAPTDASATDGADASDSPDDASSPPTDSGDTSDTSDDTSDAPDDTSDAPDATPDDGEAGAVASAASEAKGSYGNVTFEPDRPTDDPPSDGTPDRDDESPDPDGLAGEFAASHPDAAAVAGSTAWGDGDGGASAAGGVASPGDAATVDGAIGSADTSEFTYGEDAGDEDGEFLGGPASDQEMPLADHIDEMMRRLTVVVAVVGVVMIVVFPVADQLVNYLWNTHIPGASTVANRRPRLYGPLELLLTEIKVAGLAGFVIGMPVFVYQTYRFMRPGLYPNERRYYLAAVPTSLVLALIGVAFAHFVVLPAIFAYFTSYTVGTAVVAFGLKETFRLILLLMGYMALVFQIPLFMMLGIMMGLVDRRWYTEKRLLFWGGFLGLSFLVSPDPTGMAPIIIAATMIGLFEGTLLLLKWTNR